MTIAQIGEEIQLLVKNGVIRGRDTLDRDAYIDLAIQARDAVIYGQGKEGNLLTTNYKAVSQGNDYEIKFGKVELPKGYNIQGMSGVVFIGSCDEVIGSPVPLHPSMQTAVDNIFPYYIPTAKEITFKNIPTGSKFLRIYNINGADINDEISGDIAWAILVQVVKLGQQSEEKRKDTSADGNPADDYIKAAERLQINVPNQVV